MCREIGNCAVSRRAGRAPWRGAENPIYLVFVSTSLSPEDVRAAAEIHREISPDYQDAVIDSFIERVGREIDTRVDNRLAAAQREQRARRSNPLALAITSIALGIPLSGITLGLSSGTQLTGLAIVWIAIAVINVAYGLSTRAPRR